ncbi:MAG: hypothetical protein ACP5E3_20760, partial [Bacteroidales bacterium]
GEKPISLAEAQKLSVAYNISIDDLTGSSSHSVTFKTNFLEEKSYSFQNWLKDLYQFTVDVEHMKDPEVIFILNELNIFHLLQFPELCAFKMFFWQKSNLEFDNLKHLKFSLEDLDQEILRFSSEIINKFIRISTIEFTTEDCLNSILKQLLYYSEAGYFESRKDALKLCEKLHELIDHQKMQAECEYKFLVGHPPYGNKDNLRLFHNDIILADNTVIIKSEESGLIFITSNAINLMHTGNKKFFEYNYRWGMSLLKKSVQISGTAEKERNRFFQVLHNQIERTSAII